MQDCTLPRNARLHERIRETMKQYRKVCFNESQLGHTYIHGMFILSKKWNSSLCTHKLLDHQNTTTLHCAWWQNPRRYPVPGIHTNPTLCNVATLYYW